MQICAETNQYLRSQLIALVQADATAETLRRFTEGMSTMSYVGQECGGSGLNVVPAYSEGMVMRTAEPRSPPIPEEVAVLFKDVEGLLSTLRANFPTQAPEKREPTHESDRD